MGLNILVVIEENSWIDFHIAGSLEEMGHKVTRFYYGPSVCEYYGSARYAEQLQKNQALVNTAKNLLQGEGLDLIFCYVYDDFLLPKYAKVLEKFDVPLVNYNVDMACQWYRQIRTAKYFTQILCAQPDYMKAMVRYAKKVTYFPMAARELSASEISHKPREPVTFLGTPTLYRQQVLSELLNQNIPLSIYGKYWDEEKVVEIISEKNSEKTFRDIVNYIWPRIRGEGIRGFLRPLLRRFSRQKQTLSPISEKYLGGFLPTESIPSLFMNSKINIGFTRIIGKNPYLKGKCQMRLRDFEVPLAGGFYLVEKAPGYDGLFDDEKEVVTWSNFPDLLDKIKYYLMHDKEREEIALAGKQQAMKEHTWIHRFNQLFCELGIK